MSFIEADISEREIVETAKDVLELEAQSIANLINRIDESFLKAVAILHRCRGRVIVTGMGKSGLIGKKIAATFSSTGTPSFFLHPAESTHGDSGVLTRDDVVLAISNSGETVELLQLLPLIKRFGISLISMTGKQGSTLSKSGDVTLDVSIEREACPHGLAPTASTTATLAMGDALAVCLLKKRGFTAEDFLLFHPSGSLGKGLLWRVEDLMIKEDRLPIVKSDDLFKGAITEISDKKLGMAVVVDNNGKTSGILTDGDIRRTLIKYTDISSLKVQDVMTINPKIMEKNTIAAKALQIMEKYSITSIVINRGDGTPEGVIHIHDLLKAGVA